VIQIAARSTFADRQLDGTLSLRSPALKVEAKGAIDLARRASIGSASPPTCSSRQPCSRTCAASGCA
jgi:hypothetical protein